MSLTHPQKKYIKRNVRSQSLNNIANELNVSKVEIENYLKKIWRKDKYDKYMKNQNDLSPLNEFAEQDIKKTSLLNKSNYLVFAFLVIIILVVYINALNNKFTSDDIVAILNNPNIANFDNIFSYPIGWFYLLVRFFTYHIGGLNPAFYRMVNILFHIGVTIFIFVLFRKMYNKSIAIYTSVLFAVHPILVESITWISGGGYTMSGFFFLLSFTLYIFSKFIRNQWVYYLSIISYLFMMFISEKGFVLFLVFVLYELVYSSLQKNIKKIIPYFAISFASLFLIFSNFGNRVSALQSDYYQTPGLDNPFVQIPIAITEYFKLIFWPAGLTLYHTEMSFSTFEYAVRAIIFFSFVAFMVYLYIYARGSKDNAFKLRKYISQDDAKYIFFWGTFFIITLLPTLTPFRISWIVAERYVYLGSLGIFAIIGLVFYKLSLKKGWKEIIYVVFAIVIIALSTRTIIRNKDWKNEDTLWIATAKVSPSGPNIHNNLGDVYARNGDLEKAIEEFTLATQIRPNYADAFHNLANTQEQLAVQLANDENTKKANEYLNKANENYRLAIKYNPNLWQSYRNLGIMYYRNAQTDDENKGKYMTESKTFFEEAIRLQPNDIGLQFNYAVLLLESEDEYGRELLLDMLKEYPNNEEVRKAVYEVLKL